MNGSLSRKKPLLLPYYYILERTRIRQRQRPGTCLPSPPFDSAQNISILLVVSYLAVCFLFGQHPSTKENVSTRPSLSSPNAALHTYPLLFSFPVFPVAMNLGVFFLSLCVSGPTTSTTTTTTTTTATFWNPPHEEIRRGSIPFRARFLVSGEAVAAAHGSAVGKKKKRVWITT